MPLKTTLDMVQSNWCQPIAGLQIIPSHFYQSVIEAVQKNKLPGVEFSRVFWKESVIAGANREYLRVQQGRIVYDICAAPYGPGSFIACWLCIVPFRLSIWHLAGNFTSLFLLGWIVPFGVYLLISLFLTSTAWWMYHRAAVTTSIGSDFLLGMTGMGPFLKAVSEANPTYYQLDTAGVFLAVVQEGVTKCIDDLCTAQNLRPLTELERKPAAIEFRKK